MKTLFEHFPSRLFCLSNLLFWLVLNTIAADHSYRMRINFGRDADWHLVWLDFLPWWGNWAIVAPFVIAAVRTLDLQEHRHWLFALKNLGLMLVCMLLYWILTMLEVSWLENGALTWQGFVQTLDMLLMSPMHMDLLVYIAVVSFAYTQHYYASSKKAGQRNQALQHQLLKVELQALKSQLSPHFLFNTLNTISGLVRLDSKSAAVDALNELSKMFRKVLENQTSQMTSLKQEMEFIRSYLFIQKMRFENKLDVSLNVDPDAMECPIPFMLLHTLVENAVQHGSQLQSDQNPLALGIESHEQEVCITLTNRICRNTSHKGFGIGLQNCHQRLKHLYPQGSYQLTSAEQGEDMFVTKLCLPKDMDNA